LTINSNNSLPICEYSLINHVNAGGSILKKGLTTWPLTMMALGTAVGGSFYLGAALAIRNAGPAVIISYIFKNP
jgi:L-asparagine transporter-like permease